MKTSLLIEALARHSGAAPRGLVGQRLGIVVALALLASIGISVLGLGINPGLSTMGSALVVKLAYAAGLAAAAAWWTSRLARPGAAGSAAVAGIVLVIVAMGMPALLGWIQADPSQRGPLLFGQSWSSCPWYVAALSAPALVLGLWAVRGLAPTRLRLAGAAAGLMAGGLGAFGYALHCPEVSPLFVLVWYSLGMLMPAAAGAVLGPRLLRW